MIHSAHDQRCLHPLHCQDTRVVETNTTTGEVDTRTEPNAMSRVGTTLHSDTPTEDLIGRRQLNVLSLQLKHKTFVYSAGSSVLKPPFFLFPVFQFFKVFFISILQRTQMHRYSISSCNHLQSDIFTNNSSLNMWLNQILATFIKLS